MSAPGFKRGDFVEYTSMNSNVVLRGLVIAIGLIGTTGKYPRQVAFVDTGHDYHPAMVGADRLRPGQQFNQWAQRSSNGAA